MLAPVADSVICQYGTPTRRASSSAIQIASSVGSKKWAPAAIWRRMEPTRDEIAYNGLKFLRKTLG